MRLPWKRRRTGDQLIVSWSGKTLAYVVARAQGAEQFSIRRMGVEHQGTDSAEEFTRRLAGLGLKGITATVMLRPSQYQFLQIDTPAVAPDELRSAARYQIRELVNSHIDDITLDVMKVGDGQQRGAEHLFVVAVNNTIVRDVLALSDAMKWDVTVIDVQETAQRNLQSTLAAREGRQDRADAALVLAEDQQAVLTISAHDELFYTRRLELPADFLTMNWGHTDDAATTTQAFTPVSEYVPDYSVGGASYGTDYSTGAGAPAGEVTGQEPAQRFLVEVQRSLDLWDRTWSALPLAGLRVSAGVRTAELAQWLTQDMGQSVLPLDLQAIFPALAQQSETDRLECLPLLGLLLRSEARKL